MKKILITTLTLLLFATVGFSQATSGVTGNVTDNAGAVVPGAQVTLLDTKTARELSTVTNEQGSYSFTNVAPGDGYKLTFTAKGFQTVVMSNVALGVAKTETYNAELPAGDVSATVDVAATGSGETLNTTDSSIGNVIDTKQLRELPIQIRNSPAALIGLQPGVVGNNVGTGTTNRVGSVTGSRADQGNITVDGIDANDQATGQFAATVGNAPIDAIQEFRAVSTNPSAAEGRSAGGQIQLVTKSGTNDFHGSLRVYNRIRELAANSFFNNRAGRYVATDVNVIQGRNVVGDLRSPRPQLTRNQFGGNLGGPLPFFNFGDTGPGGPFFRSGKDKLFFFFDYEGRRDAQGVTYTRTVPLNHFRNGSIAYRNNNAGCTAASRLNTTPNCITILTPAQVASLDPQHVGANAALLSFINSRYPEATDFTLGDGINTGGIRFNAPSSRKDNTYTARFDFNATDHQKVFLRFNIARRTQTDTVNTVAAQFPGDPPAGLIVVKDYSVVGGHSWSITNSLFNQITIGNSHSGLGFPAFIPSSFPNSFAFGGLTAPFAGFSSQSRTVDTPTIRDDATWLKGSHTFNFGVQLKPIKSVSSLANDLNTVGIGLGGNTAALNTSLRPANIFNAASARAAYDSLFTTLLGRYASIGTNFNYDPEGNAFAPGTGKTRDFRYNEYEFYVQDNWKLRSDLTVNLGVRYSLYQPPYEANGFQAGPNTNLDTLFATRLTNGAAGISGPSSEPLLTYDLIGKANDGPAYYKMDKNNFGPRFGVAWAPSFTDGFLGKVFGDRKTSVRGGYSLVYDRVGGALTFIADQVSYIFDSSATTNFGTANATTALLNDPRFTGLNTLPVNNIPPTITRPNTPFIDGGVPVGTVTGETNYAIDQNFQVPYSHQFSAGFQRELPGNMLIDVSYVGRRGRKLFTQADAAQVVDFKDPVSGQFMLAAFNALQAQLENNATITDQPWFENQINAALLANFGVDCAAGFGSSCTTFVADNLGELVVIGDTSDTLQALYAGTGGPGGRFLNPNVGISSQFATNAYVTNLGDSKYDGLLISLQKRFSQGYQFDFNYTFSHSTDNNSSVANTVFGGLICDLRNKDICLGPSDFDIRHLINVNGIWELPFGRGKWIGGGVPSWANAIIGGFQLSGIYTYRSGLAFGTTTGSFPVGFVLNSPAVHIGNSGALSGSIDSTGPAIQFFADPVAARAEFRNPRNGEIGTRNNLRGPSYWNLDLGLAKNIKLPWEGQRIQLRVDAFNVFNHNAFNTPSVNFNAPATFGQITSSATVERNIQLAIRWDF
jgi:hypothetical protein